MHAFVKFVEGPFTGQKEKIDAKNIRYNFENCDAFDKKKKYYVKHGKEEKYHKALIIFLKESLEELETTIKSTKQRFPTTWSCVTTDGEISEKESAKTVVRSKSVLIKKEVNPDSSKGTDSDKKQKSLKEFQAKLKFQKNRTNMSGQSTNQSTLTSTVHTLSNDIQLEKTVNVDSLDNCTAASNETAITFQRQNPNQSDNSENKKEEPRWK